MGNEGRAFRPGRRSNLKHYLYGFINDSEHCWFTAKIMRVRNREARTFKIWIVRILIAPYQSGTPYLLLGG